LLQLVVMVHVVVVENQMKHMMAKVDLQNMVVAHGMLVAHIPKKNYLGYRSLN